MLRRPHLDLPRQRRRKRTYPSSVAVHLHISSMAFAKCAIDEPRYFQPATTLQPTLWGKTATIRYTCTQITTDASLSIRLLVAEPLLFGLRFKVAGAALASYFRAHKGSRANCIRTVGQTLRECRAAREAHDADRHAYGDSSCNFPWFSRIRRNAVFVAQHAGCNTRVQYPESLW